MSKQVEFMKRITKVSDNVTITLCENGYMVDVSGEDSDQNWISSKIVFDGVDELSKFIVLISKMEKR